MMKQIPPSRVNIGVWVLSTEGLTELSMCLGRHVVAIVAYRSTDYGVIRLNSLVKNVVKNDSVYMNPSEHT